MQGNDKSRFKRNLHTAKDYSSPEHILKVIEQYRKDIFWGAKVDKKLNIYLGKNKCNFFFFWLLETYPQGRQICPSKIR